MFNPIHSYSSANSQLMAELHDVMAEQILAKCEAIEMAWAALSDREQAETLAYIQELAVCGRASEHYFYIKYLERH